jgi:CBS-domain-containing membrane protein
MTHGEGTAKLAAAPLVRLRVRMLRCVHDRGPGSVRTTVFCPERVRSMDVDACRRCHRLAAAAEDAIECAPVILDRERLAIARLGADASVGDAMGAFAVSVHADLAAGALALCLDEERTSVAIVVDDAWRLVGLVDAADAARAVKSVRARDLARPIAPVHEAAPLDLAVERMVRERARALPVVDDEGCVVALLTDLDALHWVAATGGVHV